MSAPIAPVAPVAPACADPSALSAAAGYSHGCLRAGKVCALHRFSYTTGLLVGIDFVGYERRYCYEHETDALRALVNWDGEGHPPGPWIKCKGAGIDLLNPSLTQL